MRYLVFSDTHGRLSEVAALAARCQPFDAVIGAGDFYRDGAALAELWGKPYCGAQGNNDDEPAAPWWSLFRDRSTVGLVVHGHQWTPSARLQKMADLAKVHGARVVVFGHTHRRQDVEVAGIRLLNPGAVHRPRDNFASVGFLDIAADGHLSWRWEPVPHHAKTSLDADIERGTQGKGGRP